MIYGILYIIVKNLQIVYGPTMHSVLAVLFMIWMADCSVMAYTYTS